MLKKMKQYLLLWLEVRTLKKSLANSRLSDLKFAPSAIEGLLKEAGGYGLSSRVTSQWRHDLIAAFVAKAMLLVTGIDDIITLSNGITLPAIRNALFKAYGARTRDIGNIIILLNNVWRGIDRKRFEPAPLEELQATESFIFLRGQELVEQAGPSLPLGVVKMMAEQIESFTGNADDSRAAEDLIIELAIPKLKNGAEAIDFVNAFKLAPSHHRFLLAFLNTYGLKNALRAKMFADAIVAPVFHGDQVAQTILRLAEESQIDLSFHLQRKLHELAHPRKSGFTGILDEGAGGLFGILDGIFEGIFGDHSSHAFFDGRTHGMPSHHDPIFGRMGADSPYHTVSSPLQRGMEGLESLDRLKSLLAMAEIMSEDEPDPRLMAELLSGLSPIMGKDSGPEGFPFSGLFGGRPSMVSSKCASCDDLPTCPSPEAVRMRDNLGMERLGGNHRPKKIDIEGETEEEMLLQLESHLLQAHADGKLDRVMVNDMPAPVFIAMHLEIFTPGTRGILEQAISGRVMMAAI